MTVDCHAPPTARHSTSNAENLALCSSVSVGSRKVRVVNPGLLPWLRVGSGWFQVRISPGLIAGNVHKESLISRNLGEHFKLILNTCTDPEHMYKYLVG